MFSDSTQVGVWSLLLLFPENGSPFRNWILGINEFAKKQPNTVKGNSMIVFKLLIKNQT